MNIETSLELPPDAIVPLESIGFLEITGRDAASFLQGQLSCDVDLVSEKQTQLGCYCNPQGRVISFFRLCKIADRYLMRMPISLIELTKNYLAKYAVFSKVELTNVSDSYQAIGFIGAPSKITLSNYNGMHIDDDVAYVNVDDNNTRYEIYGKTDAINKFKINKPIERPELWCYLAIKNGLVELTPETSELFLPHQLNYHNLGAINFNKGCYLGQEIIARMHFRGKLKDTLKLYQLDNVSKIKPGDRLYDESQKNIAQVADVMMTSEPAGIALLVIRQDRSELTELHREDQSVLKIIQSNTSP